MTNPNIVKTDRPARFYNSFPLRDMDCRYELYDDNSNLPTTMWGDKQCLGTFNHATGIILLAPIRHGDIIVRFRSVTFLEMSNDICFVLCPERDRHKKYIQNRLSSGRFQKATISLDVLQYHTDREHLLLYTPISDKYVPLQEWYRKKESPCSQN